MTVSEIEVEQASADEAVIMNDALHTWIGEKSEPGIFLRIFPDEGSSGSRPDGVGAAMVISQGAIAILTKKDNNLYI